MSEPIKIEPHYRHQGKQLVDMLFDKGLLSESLSREGVDAVEELLSFFQQSAATSAEMCAAMHKKYKATGKGQEGEDYRRHEEETRWIARAREAEARIGAAGSRVMELKKWGQEVGVFLKEVLTTSSLFGEASRLLIDAIALGIIPEPDVEAARLKARDAVFGEGGCACPPEVPYDLQKGIYPKCGGRKI